MLDDLARSLRGAAIPGPTLLEEKGHHGNAVLTRIPPATVDRLDTGVPGREPRGALALILGFHESGSISLHREWIGKKIKLRCVTHFHCSCFRAPYHPRSGLSI